MAWTSDQPLLRLAQGVPASSQAGYQQVWLDLQAVMVALWLPKSLLGNGTGKVGTQGTDSKRGQERALTWSPLACVQGLRSPRRMMPSVRHHAGHMT